MFSPKDIKLTTKDIEVTTKDIEVITKDIEVTTKDIEVTSKDIKLTTKSAPITESSVTMPTTNINPKQLPEEEQSETYYQTTDSYTFNIQAANIQEISSVSPDVNKNAGLPLTSISRA